MILTNDDMANYHRLRDDLEDCLVVNMTATEAKNRTRAILQMLTAKGYEIHNTQNGKK